MQKKANARARTPPPNKRQRRARVVARAESTHRRDREARTAVKPVIVAQLVDLDPFLPTRRIRHRLCHDQRLWFALGVVGQVAQDAGREIEVLLERELIGREQR